MTIYTAAKRAGLEMEHYAGALHLRDTPEARELLAIAGKKIDGHYVTHEDLHRKPRFVIERENT